jgi:hypothetical protein
LGLGLDFNGLTGARAGDDAALRLFFVAASARAAGSGSFGALDLLGLSVESGLIF